MTSATRRWAKTDATQQRILDAATEVFAARGFTAATMADIVDHRVRSKRQGLSQRDMGESARRDGAGFR